MARGRAIAGRAALAVVVVVVAVWMGDYAILRYRVAANRDAFGTVTVRPYYAAPLKNKRTEFLFGDPQDQSCVRSLFPHMGQSPCWYLARHAERRIDM